MKRFFIYNSISVGLMIFSMAFGAGNLIYPLATGYESGQGVILGFLGFFFASILIPLLAFFAVTTYNGDYRKLLGENVFCILAELITLFSMLLLGPLGCIPRCTITAYASFQTLFPMISKLVWSGLFLGTCYFFATKKSNLINILGKVVGPTVLLCLFVMIVSGILQPYAIRTCTMTQIETLTNGFYSGCFTLDLLAMVFYSRVIYQVSLALLGTNINNPLKLEKEISKFLKISGTIAACIFVFVYGGMILCSALHSASVTITGQEQLIPTFASMLLGQKFGFLYSMIVVLACFSTSFALLVVFADYVVSVSKDKISYQMALALSTIISFLLANLNFSQVTKLMTPLMILTYPVLIPLTLGVLIRKFFLKN